MDDHDHMEISDNENEINNDDIIQLEFSETILAKITFECNLKNDKEFKEIKKNIYNLFSTFPNLSIKDIRKMNKSNQTCIHVLTRGDNAGKSCGKKCVDDTEYCKIHLKVRDNTYKNIQNKKEEKKEEKIEEKKIEDVKNLDPISAKKVDDVLIFYKNEYGNFVYGKTRLIFKSAKEKYIVAKEGENGNWMPLTDEDIELCKQYRLKYKINEDNLLNFVYKYEKENKNKHTVNARDGLHFGVGFNEYWADFIHKKYLNN
jgi:hypothetical protein